MKMTQAHAAALAIHGGEPVRRTRLPYARHWITEEDIQAVVDVLRSDWITTGPTIARFEEALAAFVGAKHAVSFSSGTAALHGAVFAAGLGPGDEAITTPLTFCATANCVVYQGAGPVFADILPDTLTLDPEQVASRITSRTKAILPVDYAGHPAELEALLAIAARRGLVVIEDACPALGAVYRGTRVGSVSHMTVFSFHPAKHITTGEGGMVTTDNPAFARRLRMFRNHGIETDARQRQVTGQRRYEMAALGYNYRLSDIGCALGLSQLRRLETNLGRRREIAAHYTAAFQDLPGVHVPVERPEVQSAWHLYPVQLQLEQFNASHEDILQTLRAEQLGVTVHYPLVHQHPYYRTSGRSRDGEYPVAEAAAGRLVSLPMYYGMSDEDVESVVARVRAVLSDRRM